MLSVTPYIGGIRYNWTKTSICRSSTAHSKVINQVLDWHTEIPEDTRPLGPKGPAEDKLLGTKLMGWLTNNVLECINDMTCVYNDNSIIYQLMEGPQNCSLVGLRYGSQDCIQVWHGSHQESQLLATFMALRPGIFFDVYEEKDLTNVT